MSPLMLSWRLCKRQDSEINLDCFLAGLRLRLFCCLGVKN